MWWTTSLQEQIHLVLLLEAKKSSDISYWICLQQFIIFPIKIKDPKTQLNIKPQETDSSIGVEYFYIVVQTPQIIAIN